MTKIKILVITTVMCAFALGSVWAQGTSEGSRQESANQVRLEVSDKILDKDLPSYKTNLKEIVREAEYNLKRIDGTLRERDNEKIAKEKFERANELVKEGKFEEAKNEYEAAKKLTTNMDFKRTIKESEQKIASKANEQERDRLAKERMQAGAGAKEIITKKTSEEGKVVAQPIVEKEVRTKPAAKKQPAAPVVTEKRYGTEVGMKSRVDKGVISATPSAKKATSVKQVTSVKVVDQAEAKAKAEVEAKAREEAAVKARLEAEAKAREEAAAKARMEAETRAREEAAARAKAEAEAKARAEAEAKAKAEAEAKAREAAAAAKAAAEAPKPAPAVVSTPAPAAAPSKTVAETEDISGLYREAVSLYWDNKYEEAKAKFEQVQKIASDYARTSYYLGRIKEKLGK
ncbi:MAG: hypothetical protein NC938_07575 [Candidatus Omnitrophica bacterium]|nr:hypothetical protein [Candidatus Omnitrophota bacterium]MCM8791524.1 hypothetical protein [Candidatus Omnitrophota bacterium]